jgi:uncharacterized membrane protein YgcG
VKNPKALLTISLAAMIGLLAVNPAPLAQSGQGFPPDKIEQLVAPIALYPDALLAQVLMASTYPLEIVEADRWVKANPNLKGKALDDALAQKTWDPSVISICQTPQLLDRMSSNLDWTQDLGDAFLAQQSDVMASVQKLRNEAYKTGNLKTTEQQTVVVEKEVIVIQPSSPQVVYVPAYNPAVVYGPYWAYPAPMYPAWYAPWPGSAFVRGMAWGAGFAIGASMYVGCNWHGNNVYVNNTVINNNNMYKNTNINNKNANINNKNQTWSHNPEHRGNVNYGNQQLNQKYNKGSQGGLSNSQARGYDRSAQSAGNRSGASPSATTRSGSQQTAARGSDRSTSGQRQSATGGYGNGNFEKQASQRGAESRNKPNSGMSGSYGAQKGGRANRPSGGASKPSGGGRSSGGGRKR